MSEIQVRSSLLKHGVDEISGVPKFSTRCHVNDRTCSLRIDGGCCANFVSILLVDKLNLETSKHQTPYQLKLSKGCGEIQVTEQVLISISIGKYNEEVLCDVVPMETCHILLGQPWQLQRRAKYDEDKDMYYFVFNKRWVKLLSLGPIEACKDQIDVARSFRERERNKRENEEKKEIEKESGDTLGSHERKEIECETYTQEIEIDRKSEDICFSTNQSSMPSVLVSILQDSQDLFHQKLPNGDDQQLYIIPSASQIDLEKSENEDSRTNHFKEGGNDVILETSCLESTKLRINNPFHIIEGSLIEAPKINSKVKQIKGVDGMIWDSKD